MKGGLTNESSSSFSSSSSSSSSSHRSSQRLPSTTHSHPPRRLVLSLSRRSCSCFCSCCCCCCSCCCSCCCCRRGRRGRRRGQPPQQEGAHVPMMVAAAVARLPEPAACPCEPSPRLLQERRRHGWAELVACFAKWGLGVGVVKRGWWWGGRMYGSGYPRTRSVIVVSGTTRRLPQPKSLLESLGRSRPAPRSRGRAPPSGRHRGLGTWSWAPSVCISAATRRKESRREGDGERRMPRRERESELGEGFVVLLRCRQPGLARCLCATSRSMHPEGRPPGFINRSINHKLGCGVEGGRWLDAAAGRRLPITTPPPSLLFVD